MAKKLEYEIVTDPQKGIAGLKQFSAAAKKAMREVDDSMDDTTTSAQKVAKALAGLADDLETEMKGAARAAEALGEALGPEIAGRANLDSVVVDLHKMGLTFDEITADADTLAASLKKLDDVQMSGPKKGLADIEESTSRAKGTVDDFGKSADSSKNALANMVGNSAQDVANLGGVAGSTGVLIGQMAEFMADAKFEGEGLGGVVKNFAAVAGPAAALGVVIAAVTGFMSAQAEEAEKAAQRTEDFGKAMAGAADDSVGLAESLRENIDPLREVNAGAEILGSSWANTVNEMGRSIPLLGRMFQDTKVDAVDALDATGLSIYDFTKAINGTEEDRAKFIEDLGAFRDAGFITSDQFDGLVTSTKDYAKSVDKARSAQRLMNVDLDETNALLGEIKITDDPFSRFQDRWNSLMDDLRDGRADTKETADTVNFLAEQLGLDPKEVISLALGKIGDASDEAAKQMEEAKKRADDLADAVNNIGVQWKQMSDEVSEKSFADALDQFDSLSELDLAQVRQDTVKSFDDVKAAIGKAAGEVKNWGKLDLTPDSFEELKGMPAQFADITDAVSAMRGSMQTELKAAFDSGGVKAFSDKFDFFAGQVREQFTGLFRGLGLPEDQVQRQVQAILDDLGLLPKQKEIIIKLTRDQEAKNALDLFMSDIDKIEEAQPTVDIRARIAEGDIEGAYDELNALRISQGKDPIVLPTDVDQFGAEKAAAMAKLRAQNYLNQHPGVVPVTVDQQGAINGTMNARNAGQRTANANPIIIPVTIAQSTRRFASSLFDAGGTAGPAGGIVAEKGPEILNGRYLAVQPTVVPPGTRVTSRKRTERILRHNGTRGLKRYDSGGTVTAGPSTINVNVNAAVVGNRFDVARAVKRAEHDLQRLLGTRG